MDNTSEYTNGHGPHSDPALQLSPVGQTLLEEITKIIGSKLIEQEKTTELIREHDMRNMLRELDAQRKENADGRTRIDELEKQLGERDAQLQTTTFQLETSTTQVETLQARVAELQRTNSELLTRNQAQLEAFKSNLLQFVTCSMLPTVPGPSSSVANVMANPVALDVSAIALPVETVAPPLVNSVHVVMEAAPKIEQPRSTQSWMDTAPSTLPALAALLPESPLATPLDISFDGTASDVLAAPTPSAAAEPTSTDSEMAFTGTQPESPELARPKKKVTFSPHPPEVRTIQPDPVVTGKRKRHEPLTCNACGLLYDGQRGHACSYECGFVGCGNTFPSLSAKRRHEKSHTGKEDGSEPRSSRTPTTSRSPH